MKKIALTLALFAISATMMAQIPYKVTVPVPDIEEGTMAYMVNYDTGEVVDSTAVKQQKAYFTGDVDDPYIVRITSAGNRYGTMILEQGASTINQETKMGVGSMLNDQLMSIITGLDAIADSLQNADSQEQAMSYYAKYLDTERQAIYDNSDTPIGYFLFVDYASAADPKDVMAIADQLPELKDYSRVQKLVDAAKKSVATSVGSDFVDFEVTYDGVTHRLSDYVGKGNYVLVDFWASWCGPCRREMKTIKELYNTYGPEGLKVLGVAVWDKPEDTIKAIKQLDLPWEVIIDAQTIPTDLYGISGIPCVILFGPDGKILCRGLQGQDLVNEVAKYFK